MPNDIKCKTANAHCSDKPIKSPMKLTQQGINSVCCTRAASYMEDFLEGSRQSSIREACPHIMTVSYLFTVIAVHSMFLLTEREVHTRKYLFGVEVHAPRTL